jgi:hypothetical protein
MESATAQIRRGHPLSLLVLRELPSRQNAGGDQQHAHATLIYHRSIFAFSSL